MFELLWLEYRMYFLTVAINKAIAYIIYQKVTHCYFVPLTKLSLIDSFVQNILGTRVIFVPTIVKDPLLDDIL